MIEIADVRTEVPTETTTYGTRRVTLPTPRVVEVTLVVTTPDSLRELYTRARAEGWSGWNLIDPGVWS